MDRRTIDLDKRISFVDDDDDDVVNLPILLDDDDDTPVAVTDWLLTSSFEFIRMRDSLQVSYISIIVGIGR